VPAELCALPVLLALFVCWCWCTNWKLMLSQLKLSPPHPFSPPCLPPMQYLSKGGRGGRAQSAAKGETAPIRCYG